MGNCLTSAKINLGEDVVLEINHSMQNNVQNAAMQLMVLNQNRHLYDKDGQRRIRQKMNEVGRLLEHDLNVVNPDQRMVVAPQVNVQVQQVQQVAVAPEADAVVAGPGEVTVQVQQQVA